MPTPKCPKCEHIVFSAVPYTTPEKYPVVLIVCAKCGCVVGTSDWDQVRLKK